ncbi:transcriptional regulator [Bacillus cereus]|nr:transcriptional regulator [Bacillus cereus]MRC29280.1 transcriptional regulator [Bacillus thuringiensis]HDR8042594.1 transcriptional regulator [Bacillus cereus]
MRIIIGKISLVYAILAMASVLNFGLLPDFIVDYISFFNENNAKILMYYYNWYYFRLYWITFI